MNSDIQQKTFCSIRLFFSEAIREEAVQKNFDRLVSLFSPKTLEQTRLSTLVHEDLSCMGLDFSAYLNPDQEREVDLIILDLGLAIGDTKSPLILLSQMMQFSPSHWHSSIVIVSSDEHLGPSYGGKKMEVPLDEMMTLCWKWVEQTYKGNVAVKLKEGALKLQAQDERETLQKEARILLPSYQRPRL
jgi:hypothetical protein